MKAPNVSVAIMAHPKRAAYVDELCRDLDRQPIVVWDEHQDRWDTGRRAVAAYAKGATHHLVLQDDAVVSRDLVASVEQIVSAVSDNPVCLFWSHGANRAHQRTNALADSVSPPAWVVFEGPWWGVAVVFPTKLIAKMLQLADRPRESRAYDKRLSGALVRMGIDTFYLLPSLVDHRLDGPSMISGREQEGRCARYFIGREASGLDIDYAHLPTLDGKRHPYRPRPGRRVTIPRPKPVPLRKARYSHTGEVRLSVSVMAHPARTAYVPELLETLDVPATVVWDERSDRWDTGRRAWLAHDPGATHHLVLQDDALPCRDLSAGLSKALEHVPENPVGLYVGTARPANQLMGAMVSHATRTDSAFLSGEGPWWGVGVAMPTAFIEPMLAWCDAQKIEAYDRRIASYFKACGIRCFYTMPSLVDHRSGPSLIRSHDGAKRRARRFIGSHASALDIDWSRLPQLSGERFVTYAGPAARRLYQCVGCGFHTPLQSQMTAHLRRCVSGNGVKVGA